MIIRKTAAEIEKMAQAGQILVGTLKHLEGRIRPGVSTAELDEAAERFIRARGATPTFKGYRGFPASICASPNSMVVHGIPGPERLKSADIISIDVGVTPGSEASEVFKGMERRLLKAIMNPAMIVTWITGLYIAYAFGYFRDPWLHAKLTLVVIMSAFHGYLVGRVRAFHEDRNTHSSRYYRFLNEFPTLLMIGIVILVVVKPF